MSGNIDTNLQNTALTINSQNTNELKQRSTQAGVNALTAAIVSPVAVVLQNAMVHKTDSMKSYSEILPKLFRNNIRKMPAFIGILPFTLRQSTSSALGFTGTDKLAQTTVSTFPDITKPIAAGAIMGCIEAGFTAKAEQAELKAMVGNPNVKLTPVVIGTSARNGFGWAAGYCAMKYCEEKKFSPATSFAVGVMAGGLAGISSMPLQNGVIESAKTGLSVPSSIMNIASKGVTKIFAGGISRTGIMGVYIGAATFADSILLRMQKNEAACNLR